MSLLSILSCFRGSGGSVETPPAGDYFDPVSGDITFSDAHFQYSIPGYAKTGFTARSPHGFVEFRTSETNLSVKVGGNWSTASSSFDEQSDIEVFVDGVYHQSVRLTADDTTQTIAITLPAGEKVVQLRNGYAANALSGSILLPNAGVYVQGVVTTGDIEIKIPVTPANKWLFVGDSITTGATATHPAATSFAALFREDGRSVQLDSFGARRLLTTDTTLAASMASWLSSQLNGTSTNELFILLGTNNFGLSGGHSAANFVLWYGYLLDALHAIRPDVTIYCISPINRTTYDTANSAGSTLQDYANSMVTMVSARAWGNIYYINGKPLVDLANLSDGLHPNQTGHQQYHDNLLTEYNAL